MYPNRIPLYVLAAALSASAMESEVLNSERITEHFGNYGIDVLAAKPGLRRSSLFSVEGENRVCRTYAVVKFTDQTPWESNEEHAKILAGSSIGAVFKDSGWQIVKDTIYVGSFNVDDSASEIQQLMRLDDDQELAIHVYRLSVRKGDLIVDYATIIESHHPDYLTLADLNRFYAISDDMIIEADEVDSLIALVLAAGQKGTE